MYVYVLTCSVMGKWGENSVIHAGTQKWVLVNTSELPFLVLAPWNDPAAYRASLAPVFKGVSTPRPLLYCWWVGH